MKLKDIQVGNLYYIQHSCYCYGVPPTIKEKIVCYKEPKFINFKPKVIYLGFYKKDLQFKPHYSGLGMLGPKIPRTDYCKFYVVETNIIILLNKSDVKWCINDLP